MTIQDWGSVGELLAAVATVATLGYLAVQVRQNTQSTRAENYAVVLDRISSTQAALRDDPSWS